MLGAITFLTKSKPRSKAHFVQAWLWGGGSSSKLVAQDAMILFFYVASVGGLTKTLRCVCPRGVPRIRGPFLWSQ